MKKFLVLPFLTISIICITNTGKGQNTKPKPQLCTIMGAFKPAVSLFGESNFFWGKKQISVWFMDDDGNMRNEVLRIANIWKNFSGVQFVRSYSQQSSDIRVSFRTNGWWSYIGSNALQTGKDSVTLSLANLYLYSAEQKKSTILHEFGHALGLLHEHQIPFIDIQWDTTALYKYYKETYKVDSNWVKENILEKYKSNTSIACEPDKKSIMIYEIPPGLTKNGVVVPEPLELSELDKKYIKKFYEGKGCN